LRLVAEFGPAVVETRSFSGAAGWSAPFDDGPEPPPFGDRFSSGLFISRADLSMAADFSGRP